MESRGIRHEHGLDSFPICRSSHVSFYVRDSQQWPNILIRTALLLYSAKRAAGEQLWTAHNAEPPKRTSSALVLRGLSWQEAAAQAGLQISQATAYRLLSRFRTEGAAGLEDGRHGHASKLREPVRQWLAGYCRAGPACTSRTVQTALFEHFGIRVSITHLNRIRAAMGVSRCSHGLEGNIGPIP